MLCLASLKVLMRLLNKKIMYGHAAIVTNSLYFQHKILPVYLLVFIFLYKYKVQDFVVYCLLI